MWDYIGSSAYTTHNSSGDHSTLVTCGVGETVHVHACRQEQAWTHCMWHISHWYLCMAEKQALHTLSPSSVCTGSLRRNSQWMHCRPGLGAPSAGVASYPWDIIIATPAVSPALTWPSQFWLCGRPSQDSSMSDIQRSRVEKASFNECHFILKKYNNDYSKSASSIIIIMHHLKPPPGNPQGNSQLNYACAPWPNAKSSAC